MLTTKHQPIFPVVDSKNLLIGIVNFETIQPLIYKSFHVKYTPLNEIISQPKVIFSIEEGIEIALEKMKKNKIDCIPVIKDGKYFGLLSKMDILESYREKLKEMIIE